MKQIFGWIIAMLGLLILLVGSLLTFIAFITMLTDVTATKWFFVYGGIAIVGFIVTLYGWRMHLPDELPAVTADEAASLVRAASAVGNTDASVGAEDGVVPMPPAPLHAPENLPPLQS